MMQQRSLKNDWCIHWMLNYFLELFCFPEVRWLHSKLQLNDHRWHFSHILLNDVFLFCLKVDPLHVNSCQSLGSHCFILFFRCLLILNGLPHMKRPVSAACLRWWGRPPRPTSQHTRRCWSWCPRFPRMKTPLRSLSSDTDCCNVVLRRCSQCLSVPIDFFLGPT